jgi:hypothetical protein
MDNDRPSLDLKHFEDICPDKNGTSIHKVMTYEQWINVRVCSSSCDSGIHQI